MKHKIISVLSICLLIILLFFVGMDHRDLGDPDEAYQVYLNGEKIGLIKSKDALLNMIDKEQDEIKRKYNVDKVYPPEGLSINKIYTYNNDVVSEKKIYDEVKEKEPFTIKGYTVTINYNSESSSTILESGLTQTKIYTLDKDIVKNALYKTAVAFIGEKELGNYESGSQSEIIDQGEIITSVYFAETISIKEDYISTENKIFNDQEELAMYLMFGTNEKQKTVNIKENENLDMIAESNNLNISELLVANPKISYDDILVAGQEINIGLINPLVSVKYSKQVVEVVDIAYQTKYIDDNSKYIDFKEVTTAGQNGKTKITQDILYVNGQIVNLIISNKETIVPTVDEVITRGTKVYYNPGGNYVNPNRGNGEYIWPTNVPYIITSRFEWRWGSHHDGIDISGTGLGSPIYASTSGVVVEASGGCPNRGYYGNRCGHGWGNYVFIKSPKGYTIYYAHLVNQMIVHVGQQVNQGQVIGFMGSSGNSTGTHLHFQIMTEGGAALNPCREAFKC